MENANRQATEATDYVGKKVTVTIDRPLGSSHPKHGWPYQLNYGFVSGTMSPDGEELDAYVIGPGEPLKEFTGTCIAVVHRTNDDDDKLVVVPENALGTTDEEIRTATDFQERFFESVIQRVVKNDAQAVIVKDGVGGPEFLVLRRYDREKGQTHYRLVKGGVEPGEAPEQAARRETKEETGIERVVGTSFICHYGYLGGAVRHEVDVFLVRAANNVKVTTGSAEEGGNTIFEGIWMAAGEAEANLTFKEEKALVPLALKNI